MLYLSVLTYCGGRRCFCIYCHLCWWYLILCLLGTGVVGVWFSEPVLWCRGFLETTFGRLSAWGTNGGADTLKSNGMNMLCGRDWTEWLGVGCWLVGWMSEWLAYCLLAGYSGVHKPHSKRPHFLLAQQRQAGWVIGVMPDFRVRLVGST